MSPMSLGGVLEGPLWLTSVPFLSSIITARTPSQAVAVEMKPPPSLWSTDRVKALSVSGFYRRHIA